MSFITSWIDRNIWSQALMIPAYYTQFCKIQGQAPLKQNKMERRFPSKAAKKPYGRRNTGEISIPFAGPWLIEPLFALHLLKLKMQDTNFLCGIVQHCGHIQASVLPWRLMQRNLTVQFGPVSIQFAKPFALPFDSPFLPRIPTQDIYISHF
jgi:hypothetical protein